MVIAVCCTIEGVDSPEEGVGGVARLGLAEPLDTEGAGAWPALKSTVAAPTSLTVNWRPQEGQVGAASECSSKT
jgi:hypothetical protein